MKAGKALKVAGAFAASLALLTVLAGCGQSSKSSPESETSSSAPAKSASQTSPSTQASPSPASSSSGYTPSSSASSSAPTGSSASTSASSSVDSTTTSTQSMPSNEVLYLLAYIKYQGGIQNITPSDLIVDEYMIGTQKGMVLPDVSQSDTPIPSTPSPLQMQIKGKSLVVIGGRGSGALKAVYNIDDLVNEYYSTPSQQEQVNSLLQEGERHNVLDVLAFMHSSAWISGGINFQKAQFEINNNSFEDGGADVSAYALIKGSTVEICVMSSAGANPPMYYQYYSFNAQSLLDKYYSTPAQKAQVNEYISFGTENAR